ncbi:NAD(P)-binding protein [Roseomonas sp. NAR14]|uniref:NAD(P)-binding protein n=1 Tax=Roseomonas acroporae TaxID=2937791 RepID=A0A9X1YLD8_9PROT|nr:NAD(P)-binding protein [Roseomonas acroporae]
MTRRVAIVGAGMAGLACAGALAAAGLEAVLFDKGRAAGGRIATRRTGLPDGRGLSFNHGAQYATARDPGFLALLERLRAAGHAAPWDAAGPERWCGVPAMSALPRALLADGGAVLRAGRQVGLLRRDAAGWVLHHLPAAETRPGEVAARGEQERFDDVLLAVPPAQAAPLLRAAGQGGLADRLAPVQVAPCWSLMLAFEAPVAAPDTRRFAEGPLAWIAREGSRPGADPAASDRWVAHASPGWSRRHLEADPQAVAPLLLALFRDATGAAAAPLHLAAHRWRHALTERPLGEAALWDPAAGLGLCGDWCLDGRVEAAWLSGRALAARVLGR